jgi:hypothetical protein
MHSPKTSLDVSKPLSSMEENVLSAAPKVEFFYFKPPFIFHPSAFILHPLIIAPLLKGETTVHWPLFTVH